MFIYNQWEEFCKNLDIYGMHSVTALSVLEGTHEKPFVIFKHDVETNPSKALRLAKIESKYSHKGTYYVQAYLLNNRKNIDMFKRIQELGHELSYHHDVMDSNNGDISKAKVEFEKNVFLFMKNGFVVKTVCQHGNPVIERNGYKSNRDFFRNINIKETFKDISEVMVDYKIRTRSDYKYISDAGYGWKIIYDPETNDMIDSSDKDIPLHSLVNVIEYIKKSGNVIISTHPHRWHSSFLKAKLKEAMFKTIKTIAKIFIKIPIMKRFIGRFYFIAKKI